MIIYDRNTLINIKKDMHLDEVQQTLKQSISTASPNTQPDASSLLKKDRYKKSLANSAKGNQTKLCPHLYRELAPPQHSGSSYCTWCGDLFLGLQNTRLWWGGEVNSSVMLWCWNAVKVDRHSLPDNQFLMWRFRQYCLCRVFTSVFVLYVYISPDAI